MIFFCVLGDEGQKGPIGDDGPKGPTGIPGPVRSFTMIHVLNIGVKHLNFLTY